METSIFLTVGERVRGQRILRGELYLEADEPEFENVPANFRARQLPKDCNKVILDNKPLSEPAGDLH